MVGAQYMLYGNLSSIVKAGSDEDVYYKMTMRLMDLESGLIEGGLTRLKIRKQQSKGHHWVFNFGATVTMTLTIEVNMAWSHNSVHDVLIFEDTGFWSVSFFLRKQRRL